MSRRVIDNDYYYLKVRLVSNEKIELTPVLYKNIIVTSMRTLFGCVGTALEVDLLALDADTNEAILRVQQSALTTLRAALTFVTAYDEQRCRCDVLKVSATLHSLHNTSRLAAGDNYAPLAL